MKEGRLHVGLVGKTLVHFKLLKGDLKRGPNSLTSKTALHYYLKKNNAVLLSEA
jgi:hypothetical protein